MPRLILEVEEQLQDVEDGRELRGYDLKSRIDGEVGPNSALPVLFKILTPVAKMALDDMFRCHGEQVRSESSGSPLCSLDAVMVEEMAKLKQPFPTEL
jgi:hypothetical protein